MVGCLPRFSVLHYIYNYNAVSASVALREHDFRVTEANTVSMSTNSYLASFILSFNTNTITNAIANYTYREKLIPNNRTTG